MSDFIKTINNKKIIISILFAIAIYMGVSIAGGFHDIVDTFMRLGLPIVIMVFSLSLINYILRFYRWHLYLKHLKYTIPFLENFKIYLSGFALTTTPGKIGEVLRGHFLKSHNVSWNHTLAIIMSERLSDLLVILAFSMLGIFYYPKIQGVLFLGFVIIAVLVICLFNRNLLDRFSEKLQSYNTRVAILLNKVIILLLSVRKCHSMKLLGATLILSYIAWSAEVYGMYLVVKILGYNDLSIGYICFVYAASMLIGALSFLPGGLGSSEATMITLLVLKGIPSPSAIAITLFVRLATLWFAVGLGVACLSQLVSNKRAWND